VLFDVFTSPALGEGKRSVAFSLRFRSRQRTLREEELEPILQRIIAEVEQHTGARLRR
jgi:phenylalanyl-tRNA synthetase beta chain